VIGETHRNPGRITNRDFLHRKPEDFFLLPREKI
jgi:hypothetical protein